MHLYNEHVSQLMTEYTKTENVDINRIKSTTYEEFIGEPSTVPLQIPFQLNHRSTFATDISYNPFAPKWQVYGLILLSIV